MAIENIVDSYNKSAGAKAKIKVQAFPQDSYNDSVVSAAASGKLPCIVDIDGPNVYGAGGEAAVERLGHFPCGGKE